MVKKYQGYIIIKYYQLDDMINILLSNEYIVELKPNDKDTIIINIYKYEEIEGENE